MAKKQNRVASALADAATRYPGSVEDFPWGERVAKVNKKVFAFLGMGQPAGTAVSLKLPRSAPYALSLAACQPTSHGLGKAGWVTIHLNREECPDLDLLLEWLDESYRAIAPARLVAELGTGTPR